MSVGTIEDIKIHRGNNKNRLLYQQINKELRRKIETGVFNTGDRLPAISQMAGFWQVDYRTVNSALDLLEEDGLIKREKGRGKGPLVLKNSNKTHNLMFFRWHLDSFSLQMTEGIEKYIKETGGECVIIDAKNPAQDFADIITHLGVDGVVVLPEHSRQFINSVSEAIGLRVKMVFVDRVLDGFDISSVSVDHVNGAYQATKHLLDYHNCPVFYLGQAPHLSSIRDRIQGWATAMHEYNYHDLDSYQCFIPLEDETAKPETYWSCYYHAALNFLRKTEKDKYCFFAVNDYAAKSLYAAAESAGLKVGTDVFVIGFGDYPFCQQMPIALSSVYQANERVGYEAARLLYSMLTKADAPILHRRISTELRIRKSSTG